MRKLSEILILFGIIIFIISGCKEENDEPNGESVKTAEGYIVGFDPCTINHQYRIGYVIVSTDLQDTLVTYNISDSIYTMPASIIGDLSDTLYKIPWPYFQNYGSTAYFPDSVRYKFEISVTYTDATDDEIILKICSHNINTADFARQIRNNQVIIKSVTK